MNTKIFSYSFLIFTIFFFSCKTEDEQILLPEPETSDGVFISNEGTFNFGNASVGYYSFSNQTYTPNLFSNQNGRPLGDVLQSISFANDKAYLVVNNSQKIEVVDAATFQSEGAITNLIAPRYLFPLVSQKGYVSDLYANAISVVDLEERKVIKTITLPGWTEEMTQYEEEVFITNKESQYIYILNTETDEIIDSIKVAYNPTSIQKDKNDKLWILCSGKMEAGDKGGLFRINPTTKKIEQQFAFTTTDAGFSERLRINGSQDTLYYLRKAVYQLPITASQLPTIPFIPTISGQQFYGLGVHPTNGQIFVADAIDFVQQGEILIYRADGTQLTQFRAGIIPNDFYFQ